MSDERSDKATVTLRVARFQPKAERERPARAGRRERGGSPFGGRRGSSSPFGGAKRVRGRQWTQDYRLELSPETTLLDALLTVKRTVDPSLAFRYSCGHGMCGSDAVAVNGTPTLLCTAKIRDVAKLPSSFPGADDEGFRKTGVPAVVETDADSVTGNPAGDADGPLDLGVVEIAPLPGFAVLRDLVVDIDKMLDQLRKLKPYLIADGVLATTVDGKVDVFEYLQRPEQLKKYEQLTNCILCGVCEGACPVYSGGEAFVGPAALINESRFVNDSRDYEHDGRLDMIDTADGIQACQSVRACSRPCPKGIDVGEEIWQLIAQVRER
ncbi:succinate dehydrogenase/fumarate reductase iron-sulfur subunit [Bifidobacterium choloepi]|uniref:succinate dehydrogenase n=1 Tax=Bifidobacterium choloepi TaxID=2614131 RepID=A0A6I5N8L7_9BIFI|nr:2Fe-2S iron-sulfur cluster-binding protein [Bifidobacterium choloepi]NEG70171.1 4Fe-4S dicluster domain-containing protein [Bifidobacterium choloepi]